MEVLGVRKSNISVLLSEEQYKSIAQKTESHLSSLIYKKVKVKNDQEDSLKYLATEATILFQGLGSDIFFEIEGINISLHKD